jgi:hypothetical protein
MPGDPDWMGLGKTMADAPPRMTPDEVAANPALAHAAEVLANLYMLDWSLDQVLDGADHTPHPVREFVADLIDAHHTREWRRRWTDLLAGADPREDDEDEPWLIDRDWRNTVQSPKHPHMNSMHTQSTAWEVWRTHARGGEDVRVLPGTAYGTAVAYLDECRADEEVRGFCDFYLVRAHTTRTRVEVSDVTVGEPA